jgi:hypothetical protein
MLSPTSLEQVWTPLCTPDKFPSISSDLRERSRKNYDHPKTNVVVTVVAIVVVASSAAAILRIIVPRAAAKQLKTAHPIFTCLVIQGYFIPSTTKKALTPSPSPKVGEGSRIPLPLLPPWEKGLGDEGFPLPEIALIQSKRISVRATAKYHHV